MRTMPLIPEGYPNGSVYNGIAVQRQLINSTAFLTNSIVTSSFFIGRDERMSAGNGKKPHSYKNDMHLPVAAPVFEI